MDPDKGLKRYNVLTLRVMLYQWVSSLVQNQIFGSQNLATKFGKHLFMATKIDSQCSQLHRLVNTGLAVGSLDKWLPIKVANTSKTDKF